MAESWREFFFGVVDGNEALEQKLIRILEQYTELSGNINVQSSDLFKAALDILKYLELNSNNDEPFLADKLDECLAIFDENFNQFGSFPLDKVQVRLELFSKRPVYQQSFLLWKIWYLIEALTNPKSVEDYQAHFEATKDEEYRLPTKSLMVLKQAFGHMIKKEMNSLDKQIFLRFYLKQLITSAQDVNFKETFQTKPEYKELIDNVKTEIARVLWFFGIKLNQHSITDLPVLPEDNCIKMDWEVCSLVLNFYMPADLKIYYEYDKYDEELIEVIEKFKRFLQKSLTVEIRNNIEHQYMNAVRSYRMTFDLDQNGQLCQIEHTNNGIDLLEPPYPEDLSLEQRRLAARVLYILAYQESRKEGDQLNMLIMRALSFGREALGDQLMSSLWMLLSQKTTKLLANKEFKVLEQADDVLYPFYMAFLLSKTDPNVHLCLGIVLYLLSKKYEHYIVVSSVQTIQDKVQQMVNALKTRYKVHFELAIQNLNGEMNIKWLVAILRIIVFCSAPKFLLSRVSYQQQLVQRVVECLIEATTRETNQSSPNDVLIKMSSQILAELHQRLKTSSSIEVYKQLNIKVVDFLNSFQSQSLSNSPQGQSPTSVSQSQPPVPANIQVNESINSIDSSTSNDKNSQEKKEELKQKLKEQEAKTLNLKDLFFESIRKEYDLKLEVATQERTEVTNRLKEEHVKLQERLNTMSTEKENLQNINNQLNEKMTQMKQENDGLKECLAKAQQQLEEAEREYEESFQSRRRKFQEEEQELERKRARRLSIFQQLNNSENAMEQ